MVTTEECAPFKDFEYPTTAVTRLLFYLIRITKRYTQMDDAQAQDNSTVANRELTYGEKAVGITFNPGGNPDVEKVKRQAADLIDTIYDRDVRPIADVRNGEKVAQATLAIRRIQEGQMWAVKAITWQY